MSMKKDIILLDGSAGTALWQMAEAEGAEKLPVWRYNIEKPHLVLELHRRYIEAGSKYIQTNTFSANVPAVEREGRYSAEEVIAAAVELARQATEGTDVKFYLSFGPLSALLSPYGKLTEAECREIYGRMLRAGAEAGAELVALETFMDLRMLRIAADCAREAGLKFIASMTFEKRRRTMMGDTIEKICASMEEAGAMAVGMNCSYGPVKAYEIIKSFSENTRLPLYYKPNAGMGEGYDAQQFAREVEPALELVSFVGGCCGCDESYIKELGKLL